MDEKRKGEIALALLKYQLSRKDIWLGPDMKRGMESMEEVLGNIAKAIGIPSNEQELLKDCFRFFIFPPIEREIVNISKATGIPLYELKEFMQFFIKELLERVFSRGVPLRNLRWEYIHKQYKQEEESNRDSSV